MPHTVRHLNLNSLEILDRTNRSPVIPNELRPGIRKHKILDTSLGSIKDRSVKVHRNITPVLNAVLNRTRILLQSLPGVRRRRRRQIESVFIKRTGGITGLALLAVHKTRRLLENVFQLPQLLVRDVDGELGMADADKLRVDVQREVEVFADDVALALFLEGAAVLDGLRESAAPFCDAGQEDDVLAGEFAQSGEFLEGGGVALEDVLECAHC